MNFWNRVGTFLLFVGLVLATLFLFSDMAGVVQIKFLLWGALAIVAGGADKMEASIASRRYFRTVPPAHAH